MRSVIDQLYRGRLPAAERALSNALLATKQGLDPCVALRQSAKILRAAHWVPAMRFNDALLGAWSHVPTPQVADLPKEGDADSAADLKADVVKQAEEQASEAHAESTSSSDSVELADDASHSKFTSGEKSSQNNSEPIPVLSLEAFQAAIYDFLEVIKNTPLRELAWSSSLVEHYSALCACKSKSVASFVEECAGAGRILPSAAFRTSRTDAQLTTWLTELRTHYERALFTFLNTKNEEAPLDIASQDELKACLGRWLAPEGDNFQTYDMGRLIKAWIQVQSQVCKVHDSAPSALEGVFNAQTRRIYALLNPLWIMKMLKKSPCIEEVEGVCKERVFVVPPACVRALVISLWGMFLIYRTQSQATEAGVQAIADLLTDYGIVVSAEKTNPNASQEEIPSPEALVWWERIGLRNPKRVGVLELSQDAYENFHTQMHYIETTLAEILQAVSTTQEAPAHTLLLSEEIGRLADLAYTVGFGDLAFFVEQLSTAWRYHAFGVFQMRSNTLMQAVIKTCDNATGEHSRFKEQTDTQDAVSAQKSAIHNAQITLIDLTRILLQGLEVLGADNIPNRLTRAHQQALTTLIGYSYWEVTHGGTSRRGT